MSRKKRAGTEDYLEGKYGRRLLKPSELAGEVGCHPSHIRAMCQCGDVHAVKIGCRWYVPVAECARVIEGKLAG